MNTTQNPQIPRQSLIAPVAMLRQQGIPIRTIIDIGCADGTFALECLDLFGRDLSMFNIDAQVTYEPSLRRIREKAGGHYRIAAVSSFNGRIRFSVNEQSPYWSKLGDEGNFIECRTLDSLLAECPVPGPYLIKMDIEGAEFSALQGAVNILDDAAAVILETEAFRGTITRGSFLDIHTFLAARNFALLDLINFGYRAADQVLFEFYAAFLNRRYEFRHRLVETGGTAADEGLVAAMSWRRSAMQARNEEILARWSRRDGSESK